MVAPLTTSEDAESAEGEGERWHLGVGDQQPVHGADQSGRHEADHDRRGCQRPQGESQQDRREHGDRRVGQIDGADVQDHRLAEGHQQDRGRLNGQDPQPAAHEVRL